LFLHLDGARLFNSAATLGCDAREIAGHCDTLMFCLSKGLGAPAGSMLAGPAAFVAEARRIRKQLGGAMRQVGILAAAGIVALEKMTGRLADDHRRARTLAAGIAAIDGLRIDPAEVESNIVIFNITRPERKPSALCEALRGDGVLCMPFGPGRVRMVTHGDVDDKDVEKALSVLNKIMG
jgi:threonine aldolase